MSEEDDLHRESLIDGAYQSMLLAETPEAARDFFEVMCTLVRGRSAEQIFAMEAARHLT